MCLKPILWAQYLQCLCPTLSSWLNMHFNYSCKEIVQIQFPNNRYSGVWLLLCHHSLPCKLFLHAKLTELKHLLECLQKLVNFFLCNYGEEISIFSDTRYNSCFKWKLQNCPYLCLGSKYIYQLEFFQIVWDTPLTGLQFMDMKKQVPVSKKKH